MLYNLRAALGLEPVHQNMQKRCTRPSYGLPLCQKPTFEVLMVRYSEAFEEFAPKLGGQVEQTLCRERIGASRKLPSNFQEVDVGSLGIKEYILPIGR